MRIFASLVVRNEADRYLESCLKWNSQWWDELFVYDDRSDDDTVPVCARYTDKIVIRPEEAQTFLEDEGAYRSAAWESMGEVCGLTDEDWVFSIDADEFLVPKGNGEIRETLRDLAQATVNSNHNSADIRIPEVWSLDGPRLMLRQDGWWATMSLPRLTRYLPDDKVFRNKKMGCGSTPKYSYQQPLNRISMVTLLHFGYAREEDRRARYDRYMGLPDHGHNPKHIKSIISKPTLEPWPGVAPKFKFGRES